MNEPKRDDEPECPEDTAVIEIESGEPEFPVKIGRFDVVRRIAQGAHATIYEVATPERPGQRLALKLAETDDPSVLRWLNNSITIQAGLEHPHILPCNESEAINGRPYVVMPLVDGGSLMKMISRQHLPDVSEILRIVLAAAKALDFAHGRKVVHGNVHPKNILLDRTGHVWLIGFGDVCSEYPEEMCFGNPHYLAPEQLHSFDQTVPQSDVYALAEVAFLLLNGSFPFQNLAILDLLNWKRSGFVPSIREIKPKLPHPVDTTFQRAMALRPEDRFPSAGQFVTELESAFRLAGESEKNS